MDAWVPPPSTSVVIAELGRGGMAEVFLALRRNAGFAKLIVVKRLLEDHAADDGFRTMFIDEARLAARLSHPNVVQTLQLVSHEDRLALEMEYLEGQPLNRLVTRLRRKGRGLPVRLVTRIVAQALEGLHYAHELADFDGTPMNVVHRDVSPQNVFVTYAGQVKVVDFGIAKAMGQLSVTALGTVKGKVQYMPPEQAMGGRVDRRVDVFAVGVILWELLAGRRYWEGVSQVEVFARLQMKRMPPRVREVNAEVPEELDDIVARALAPDASERFGSARELRDALEDAGFGHGGDRELGALVSELFADDRAKVKDVVERAVARMPTSSGRMPVVVPAAAATVPVEPAKPEADTQIIQTLTVSPTIERREVRREPVAKASNRLKAGVALAVALAAGAGLYAQSRGHAATTIGSVSSAASVGSTAAASARASATAPPSAPSDGFARLPPMPASLATTASPRPSHVQVVTVRAFPASARLFVDGVLQPNPVTRTLVIGSRHHVHAEADGFEAASKTVDVRPGEPIVLDLEPASGTPNDRRVRMEAGDPWDAGRPR